MYTFTKSVYYLELYYNETLLSTATGFFIKYKNKIFILTNKHVVTGLNPDTGDCLDKQFASIPNKMRVFEPITNRPIAVFDWDESSPQEFWEFSKDNQIDIAIREDDQFYMESIELVEMFGDEKWLVSVTEKLVIVGYPYGRLVSNIFPTYVTGFLATDLNLDYNNKPLFLIDSRTREGQSGSPVFYIIISGHSFNQNTKSINFVFGEEKNPGIKRFLGIYSGRVNKESDLGRVWKRDAIIQILIEIENRGKNESK